MCVVRAVLCCVVILLCCVPLVCASVGSSASVTSPSADSLHRENISVNVTFDGTANLSGTVDNGSGPVALFSASSQSSPYAFTWESTNGSFPDGSYNLSILVLNSTNASDNASLSVTNVTVDNTPPNITLGWPPYRANLTEANATLFFPPLAIFSVNATVVEAHPPAFCDVNYDYIYDTGSSTGTVSVSLSNGILSGDNALLIGGSLQALETWNVTCFDLVGGFMAGNRGWSENRMIYYDLAVEGLTISSPAASVNDSAVILNISADEWHPASPFFTYILSTNGTTVENGSLNVSEIDATLLRNRTLGDGSYILYRYRYVTTWSLANGNYTLNVSAFDTFGNNATTSLDFSVAASAPVSSVVFGSASASGASFTLGPGSADSLVFFYGAGSPSTRVSASAGAFSLSGLSAGTRYAYVLQACDAFDNCANSSVAHFSTLLGSRRLAPPSVTGAQPYRPPSLSVLQRRVLSPHGSLAFSLGGSSHAVELESFSSSSATFVFRSSPVRVVVALGASRLVDLDGDGVSDVNVTLEKVQADSVVFSLTAPAASVVEPAPVENAASAVEPAPVENASNETPPVEPAAASLPPVQANVSPPVLQSSSASNGRWWLLTALAIVLLALLVWAMRRRER